MKNNIINFKPEDMVNQCITYFFRLERIYNINKVVLQTGTDNSMSQIGSNTTLIKKSITQNINM